MFYEISQNNSGGHFDVNDKLYHRLIIEADSAEKAAVIGGTNRTNRLTWKDFLWMGMPCPLTMTWRIMRKSKVALNTLNRRNFGN